MARDPVCGMDGRIRKHGFNFCSLHCVQAYEQSRARKPRPWFLQTFWLIVFAVLAIALVSHIVPALTPLAVALREFFGMIWWAVLLGLLLGGVIDRFVPQEYVSKYLASSKKRTIIAAAFLGFVLSACSHGILAIAIQLYKKGASVPAVIAFLMAAPWANLPVTILMFSFFGTKAFLLLFFAIVIAIVSGLVFQLLDRLGWIEKGITVKFKDFSLQQDVRKRWRAYRFDANKDIGGVLRGTWVLAKMVLGWILIGMTLASIARAFVPEEIFHEYMGVTVLGMVVTLVLATIIEVCSEGSSPMAFEIYRQTGAFGNSFIFLMAGVATDYTEIGLIWSNIGKKAALWLPVVTVPQILLVAWLFNLFL